MPSQSLSLQEWHTRPRISIRCDTIVFISAKYCHVDRESACSVQVAALPQGKVPAETKARDEKFWYPYAEDLKGLDEIMFIQEESSLFNRVFMTCIGCLNLRPLKLHFMELGTDVIVGDRPYRIGGCCGYPLEMRIRNKDTLIGKVIENFEPYGSKCYESCCLCTSYTSVQMEGQSAYTFTLRRSNCCCGRINNCCGATCFNETLIIDVLDSNDKMVGVITRYYAPGENCEACCRAGYGFVNFALKFPEYATSDERLMLLSAMMAQEYQFSRTGGDDSN